MYFSGLEAFGQAYDPYLKAFARAQLEVAGLMSRRAQAYMEIPARLSRCRSPQDVAEEQMQFWRSVFEDYSASTTRITRGLASIAAPTFGLAASDDEMDSARDYITFPEPEEAARPGRPRDRRAA
jgi:hypothetical protein